MKNHTPTPWEVRSSKHHWSVVGPDGESVLAYPHDKSERRANAAFIVLACNVHDELLAFIEDIRPFLGNDPEATLHKQADALIAKAKGEIRIAGEAS